MGRRSREVRRVVRRGSSYPKPRRLWGPQRGTSVLLGAPGPFSPIKPLAPAQSAVIALAICLPNVKINTARTAAMAIVASPVALQPTTSRSYGTPLPPVQSFTAAAPSALAAAMSNWHSDACLLAAGWGRLPLRRTPVAMSAPLGVLSCGGRASPLMAAIKPLHATARRNDRDRSLSRPAGAFATARAWLRVSKATLVIGCFPARSARRRAWTSFSGLPTRLPPFTGPRHGRASPRPRNSAYEPHRSHQVTLPVTMILCESCLKVASSMERPCVAFAHLCLGSNAG